MVAYIVLLVILFVRNFWQIITKEIIASPVYAISLTLIPLKLRIVLYPITAMMNEYIYEYLYGKSLGK